MEDSYEKTRRASAFDAASALLTFAAQAKTIALQTDPPLYIVESYPDNWESCYDLLDADGIVVQALWADCVVRMDEVLIIRQNGLFGYMGYDGNWLAEPQFDDVRNFSEGMARRRWASGLAILIRIMRGLCRPCSTKRICFQAAWRP